MSKLPLADLAWLYTERCNRHAQEEMIGMYEWGISYHSNQYGAVTGLPEVSRLSSVFFETYPDAHWKVDKVDVLSEDTTQFDFIMRGTDQETGKRVERKGTEQLRFSDFGLITHIDVDIHSVH